MLSFFVKLPPNHYIIRTIPTMMSLFCDFCPNSFAAFINNIYIYSESIDIYSLDFSVLRTNFKTTLRPISHYNYIAPSEYELDLPEP